MASGGMRRTPALLLALAAVALGALLLLGVEEREAGQEEELRTASRPPTLVPVGQTGKEGATHAIVLERAAEPDEGALGEAEEAEQWRDEFAVSLEEAFDDGGKATVLWRLAFPGTSSSSLRDWLARAAPVPASLRLASCQAPTLVGCARAPPYIAGMEEAMGTGGAVHGGEEARQVALEAFRWTAGKHMKLEDFDQHMALAKKREGVEKVQLPKEEGARQDHTLVATMLREPGQYAKRAFFNQFDVVKGTPESMRRRLCSVPLSNKMIFFDWAFEERSQHLVTETTLAEWIDLAHWRWNYFTRGLADDYRDTLWIRCEADDPTTREEAMAKNRPLEEEGANLLARAQRNLMEMAFFGIYDRLAESAELLSFTFCWDVEKTGFAFKEAIGLEGMPAEEHVQRAEQVLSDEELAVLRRHNQLDMQLFEFADLEFGRRVQAMRYWKQQGFACRDYASDCGLRCS